MNSSKPLKLVAVVVVVLLVALFLAAELSVAYRSMKAPEGFDQSRLHWNTKNTTRFDGGDADGVASQVSRAVYPATGMVSPPDVVILYNPADWQGGLQAASLLRPLNAVLLPATAEVQEEIERLQPTGSDALNGAQVLRLGDAPAPTGNWQVHNITAGDVASLLADVGADSDEVGGAPRHVIIVDRDDPATALLAARWLPSAVT